MSIGRRGFLKRIGTAALIVVSAPLYIPSERLDFGVPKRIITPDEAQRTPFVFDVREFVHDTRYGAMASVRPRAWITQRWPGEVVL